MDATQVDVVLDGLVSRLRAAVPNAEVIDGQPVATSQPEVLVVGWSANRVAVEIVQTRPDMTRDRRHETLSIVCLASSARGETESTQVARANAVALLEQVKATLAADRRLGGIVRRAQLGLAMSLDQAQGDGAAATIEFTIDVTTL